jgi:NAD-dependent dihydropyrimidine dehydrogenase PreA subunit
MSLFTIDPVKCKRDGFCAEVCPLHLIDFTDREAAPKPVEGGEEECLRCGHCMSVCPHGALQLGVITLSAFTPIAKEFSLSFEQVDQLLRGRRSCRVYKAKMVPRRILEQLIRMGGYAPSGHNSQPTSWLVIHDRSEVRRLAGLTVEYLRKMLENEPEFARSLIKAPYYGA